MFTECVPLCTAHVTTGSSKHVGVRGAWCGWVGADGAHTRGPSGHQAVAVERMAFGRDVTGTNTFQRRPPSGPSQVPTGPCACLVASLSPPVNRKTSPFPPPRPSEEDLWSADASSVRKCGRLHGARGRGPPRPCSHSVRSHRGGGAGREEGVYVPAILHDDQEHLSCSPSATQRNDRGHDCPSVNISHGVGVRVRAGDGQSTASGNS